MTAPEKEGIREWIFSLKNDEDIRITGAQLKSAWLRTKEKLTLAEIASRIDADSGNVSKYLQKFEERFQALAKIIDELRGYRALNPEELLLLGNKRKIERLQQGYYVAGTRPFGYLKDGKLLRPDPHKSSVVKRLFLQFKQGRTIGALSKETGLEASSITRILMNPIYKGKIRWSGTEYSGKHEPLVDEDLWDEVQELLTNRDKGRPAPLGTRWVSIRLERDPDKAALVQRVFEARVLQRRTFKELEGEFGIPEGTLRHMMRNRIYLRLGIVKPELFEAANRLGRSVGNERRKKKIVMMENKILNSLRASSGQTTRQLAERLNYSYSYVQDRLYILEKQGRIERLGLTGKERLWRIKEPFSVS